MGKNNIKRPQKYVLKWWGKVSLLLVGLYLVIYPILPNFLYQFQYKNNNFYPYETQLLEDQKSVEGFDSNGDEDNSDNEKQEERKEIPQDNRIVIPKIHVDMPIVEGQDDSVLDVGIWHRPGTGVPGWGNMVLTGHRVGYAFLPDKIKASTSFYNLDKLDKGDYIIVYWGEREYDYEITSHEIVYPAERAVESQSVGERLTLYTCHPVGSNAQRLVYYARRIT